MDVVHVCMKYILITVIFSTYILSKMFCVVFFHFNCMLSCTVSLLFQTKKELNSGVKTQNLHTDLDDRQPPSLLSELCSCCFSCIAVIVNSSTPYRWRKKKKKRHQATEESPGEKQCKAQAHFWIYGNCTNKVAGWIV